MSFYYLLFPTLGLENEGIFDTWQLLSALREKNLTLGVRYLKGEMEGIWNRRYKSKTQFHGMKNMSTEEANLEEQKIKHIHGAMVMLMTFESYIVILSSDSTPNDRCICAPYPMLQASRELIIFYST